MNYSKKEKLSLLSDMIRLAKSDSILKQRELNFILAVANSLQISKNEVNELIDKPAEKVVFKNEAERILHFHRLVLLMNIDQQTSLSEITALKNFGLHLGLPAEAIDVIFKRMDKYPDKVIPPNEIIEIFKRFYN